MIHGKIHMIPCFKNRYVHLVGVSVLLIRLDLVYSGCLKPIQLASLKCSKLTDHSSCVSQGIAMIFELRKSGIRFSSMPGMTIAFNPALTYHLFKGVLVAFPSSKLSNQQFPHYLALEKNFQNNSRQFRTPASCQSICSSNDTTIYIAEEFYSLMKQYELKMIFLNEI